MMIDENVAFTEILLKECSKLCTVWKNLPFSLTENYIVKSTVSV